MGGFCKIKSKQHANTGLRELLLTVLLAMSVDTIPAAQCQVEFLPCSHHKQSVHPVAAEDSKFRGAEARRHAALLSFSPANIELFIATNSLDDSLLLS